MYPWHYCLKPILKYVVRPVWSRTLGPVFRTIYKWTIKPILGLLRAIENDLENEITIETTTVTTTTTTYIQSDDDDELEK